MTDLLIIFIDGEFSGFGDVVILLLLLIDL